MSRGVRSCQAAASARNSKLTRGTLPFPPRESGERNKRTQRHQVRREEIQWTYLPLHRPLHAASVQSKSRTESLVEGLGRLFLSSLRSTAAHLPHWGAGGIWVLNRVAAEEPGRVCRHLLAELMFTAGTIPAGLSTPIKALKSSRGKHEHVSELLPKPGTCAAIPCPTQIFEHPTRSVFCPITTPQRKCFRAVCRSHSSSMHREKEAQYGLKEAKKQLSHDWNYPPSSLLTKWKIKVFHSQMWWDYGWWLDACG